MKLISLFFIIFSINSFAEGTCQPNPSRLYSKNRASDLKKLHQIVGTYKLKGGDNCGILKMSTEELCDRDEWRGTSFKIDIFGKDNKIRQKIFYETLTLGHTGMEYFRTFYQLYRFDNLTYLQGDRYGYGDTRRIDMKMKNGRPVSFDYNLVGLFLKKSTEFSCSIL